MAPCSVPFQVPFSGRAELQNPQQGDVSNCESVGRVEAFCGRSRGVLYSPPHIPSRSEQIWVYSEWNLVGISDW